eukprot:358891-Chlamydomonas_euryale.AAC.2
MADHQQCAVPGQYAVPWQTTSSVLCQGMHGSFHVAAFPETAGQQLLLPNCSPQPARWSAWAHGASVAAPWTFHCHAILYYILYIYNIYGIRLRPSTAHAPLPWARSDVAHVELRVKIEPILCPASQPPPPNHLFRRPLHPCLKTKANATCVG